MSNQSSGEYPDFEPPSGSPGWEGLGGGEPPPPQVSPPPVSDVWSARAEPPAAYQPVVDPSSQPRGDSWAPPSAAQAATVRQHSPGPQSPESSRRGATVRPGSSPSRSTPVTWGIIAICVAVWVGELTIPQFFERVMLTPRTGALEPWRFITSAFAHSYSFTHIAFNMYALWVVGRILEPFLGWMRFLALYLVSALAGGAAVVLLAGKTTMAWDTGVVGASGAVFGLFGALLVITRVTGANTTSLVMLLAINAVIGFVFPNIAWQAHLGGFLAGIAVSWLMIRNVRSVSSGGRDRTWWQLAGLTGLILLSLVGKYALF